MVFSGVTFLFYFLPTVLFFYFIGDYLNSTSYKVKKLKVMSARKFPSDGMESPETTENEMFSTSRRCATKSFSRFIDSAKYKNLILFIFSLIFYSWGEPVYVFIMLFSTMFDYTNGLLIEKFKGNEHKRKTVLIISVVGNLAILGFFKYTDFLIGTFNDFTGLGLPLLKLALPIGISFYTFQTMSYTIDVYRGNAPVQKNIIDFGAYVTLFPQLIAGPIVRYGTIAEQLNCRSESFDMFADGVSRFCIGLGKKVLLANNIGMLWDTVRAVPQNELSVLAAWMGIFAFAFQIYFDFSGYSDMAIGLGKMFGFEFPENFNYPYISKSITEFWRRWHISLGSWFREYVYIPMGGNRVKPQKMFFNIFTVWLLTGLWHGASWNFAIWGIYYGALLVLEKKLLKGIWDKTPGFICRIYTQLMVLIGWVIFAFDSPTEGMEYLKTMFGFGEGSIADDTFRYGILSYWLVFLVLIIAATPIPKIATDKILHKQMRWLKPVFLLILFFVEIAYLVNAGYNPFLYFRF